MPESATPAYITGLIRIHSELRATRKLCGAFAAESI